MVSTTLRHVAVVLATVLSLAACGGASASTPPATQPAQTAGAGTATATVPASAAPATPAASPVATNTVTIVDFAFTPDLITVKVGTKVTWTNSGRTHTVTADDGSFDSGHIGGGSTFSTTFSKAGAFPYHCAIHSSMTGQVLVTP